MLLNDPPVVWEEIGDPRVPTRFPVFRFGRSQWFELDGLEPGYRGVCIIAQSVEHFWCKPNGPIHFGKDNSFEKLFYFSLFKALYGFLPKNENLVGYSKSCGCVDFVVIIVIVIPRRV